MLPASFLSTGNHPMLTPATRATGNSSASVMCGFVGVPQNTLASANSKTFIYSRKTYTASNLNSASGRSGCQSCEVSNVACLRLRSTIPPPALQGDSGAKTLPLILYRGTEEDSIGSIIVHKLRDGPRDGNGKATSIFVDVGMNAGALNGAASAPAMSHSSYIYYRSNE